MQKRFMARIPNITRTHIVAFLLNSTSESSRLFVDGVTFLHKSKHKNHFFQKIAATKSNYYYFCTRKKVFVQKRFT